MIDEQAIGEGDLPLTTTTSTTTATAPTAGNDTALGTTTTTTATSTALSWTAQPIGGLLRLQSYQQLGQFGRDIDRKSR